MTRLLATLALFLGSLAANAGEIRTSATVDKNDVRLSDSVTVTLIVEADAPVRVEPDREILNEATAEVWRARASGAPKVVDLPGQRQRWTQTYRLDPFVPGDLTLTFAQLKVFVGVAPDPVLVNGPSVTVRVGTALAGSGAGEARPITGIEAVPPAPAQSRSWVRTLGLATGSILLVGGAVFVVLRRLRRKPIPLSPWQRAVAELDALEDREIPEGVFTERLAVAVRGLVGTATATTEELLTTVPVELRDDLEAVLARCDLAKFAGVRILDEEREPLLNDARRLLNATKPVESPPRPRVNEMTP